MNVNPFELARDIRNVFRQARQDEDLTWLELIGAGLVEAEARQGSIEAGRVSTRRPREAALHASALWREAARRTGRRAAIDHSLAEAETAETLSRTPGERAASALEAALTLMAEHDLRGAPGLLDRASACLVIGADASDARLSARVDAAHARLSWRTARRGEDAAGLTAAAALMDAALHRLETVGDVAGDAFELRLDRAALTLESGIASRDARLLDQAGRDLHALVEAAPADRLPLTHARALTLCAAGLSRLAVLAGDLGALTRSREMFDAAADAFTPDHSPLDWAAVQLAMAAGGRVPGRAVLMQAEALTDGEGLTLGALARSARSNAEIAAAENAGDGAALEVVETRLMRRLRLATAADAPLDWASDQIALAEVAAARARMTNAGWPRGLDMALAEAEMTAAEHGCVALAVRARKLAAQAVQLATSR